MAKSTGKVVLWHLLMAGAALGTLAAWRWQRRWGATAAEQRAVLPGDDLIPQPLAQATRAIGIDAPPDVVWPWLKQLGYGKAGFYSYAWLQRLAGLDIENADAIVPEWADIEVGSTVNLAEDLGLSVACAEPERALVLVGAGDPPPGMGQFDFSWAFVLEPEGPVGTRLVVRERYSWSRWLDGLTIKAVGWVSFVMSRAMLQGIRARAERSWQDRLDARLDDAAADVPESPSAVGSAGAGDQADAPQALA
ncbi:MAG: hypothetical protein LBC97_02205 [Bifidobacteriaceae bacterium]|jgi:hypothetical protein|nr:hypothetical protein [Bifidobacteriaceae bacterium]